MPRLFSLVDAKQSVKKMEPEKETGNEMVPRAVDFSDETDKSVINFDLITLVNMRDHQRATPRPRYRSYRF